MGNIPSSYFDEKDEDPYWANDVRQFESQLKAETSAKSLTTPSQNLDSTKSKLNPVDLSEENKQKLNEFKLELARKHEKKRQIIAEKRREMEELRAEIEELRRENHELKFSKTETEENEEIDKLRKENEELRSLLNEKSAIIEESEIVIKKNHELRISIAEMQEDLQKLNTEVINFESEREDYKRHVVALKDVIAVSKNMLNIRETQLKELKVKVETIEKCLADREATIMSENLRKEYERQITNMKTLRILYEERQRAERREKEEIILQLDDAKKDLELEKKKCNELHERIAQLEVDNSTKYDEVKKLESNLGLSRAETRQCQAELAVINQLFSETLLRYNSSQELNLDKLQKHLEDHHGLLKDIVVNEVSSEVSYALPKVLLELINQLYAAEEGRLSRQNSNEDQTNGIEENLDVTTTTGHQMNSAEEIVENLPKVWRILIELLSHQIVPTNILTEGDEIQEDPCYKKVETAKGTSCVPSVSQTFIRLKDLILEKKSLEKETAHLKHLNCHLENRLQDQEKRLELVHNELSKTWLVVGKLQKQHQMLHTQEKILRYELAQKRKLLNELKEELEYSREKWAQAREKNSNTEKEWKQLRTEFASRRKPVTIDDLNNSGESGYSDERECSTDEEPGYETDVSECDKKIHEEEKDLDLEVEFTERNSNTHSSLQVENNGDGNVNTTQDEETKDNTNNIEVIDNIIVGVLSENQTSIVDEDNTNNTLEPRDFQTYGQTTSTVTPILHEAISPKDLQTHGETASAVTPILHEEISPKDVVVMPSEDEINKPSTSSSNNNAKLNLEEILARREERLRRLEGQASSLVTQAVNTANRSVEISNKLDNLHEIYGDANDDDDDDEDEKTTAPRTSDSHL